MKVLVYINVYLLSSSNLGPIKHLFSTTPFVKYLLWNKCQKHSSFQIKDSYKSYNNKNYLKLKKGRKHSEHLWNCYGGKKYQKKQLFPFECAGVLFGAALLCCSAMLQYWFAACLRNLQIQYKCVRKASKFPLLMNKFQFLFFLYCWSVLLPWQTKKRVPTVDCVRD